MPDDELSEDRKFQDSFLPQELQAAIVEGKPRDPEFDPDALDYLHDISEICESIESLCERIANGIDKLITLQEEK